MQCFRHQVSDLRKRGFNLFSVVVLQKCFIGLVFSCGVLPACSQDVYACIGSDVLKGIAGIATIIIDTISFFEVPQQLTDGLTVMFTAGYKTALHRDAPGSSDDLHLHAIEVLVLTGTASPIDFSLQQFTPADAHVVAHRQWETIQDIAATTSELFDNSSQLLKQTVKQVC